MPVDRLVQRSQAPRMGDCSRAHRKPPHQPRRLPPTQDRLNDVRRQQGQPQDTTPLDSVHGENETFRYCIVVNSNGRRMGRYKDYREPKRRGYDDDYGSSDRPAGGGQII